MDTLQTTRQGEGKLYQDQIYGTKILGPLAVAIIDTPEFQRLAGLKQLGFADLVYRGARHTRLEHSIGTYFISRTIMRRIVQNHERLGLDHPGKHISASFRYVPSNANLPEKTTTYQSCWRGLSEVVSAAALLHDLGHVPFGHTLEDEFSGLYERHDHLAGPRFHEMLYNKSSELAKVFSDSNPRWLPKISNNQFRELIYVTLNWKENIRPTMNFEGILRSNLKKVTSEILKIRLEKLLESYNDLTSQGLFHPFMSDIVGNTICSDILDYLPRDRTNLGMEPRHQTRLHRYFTIRQGTLYEGDGLRMSIMVTRRGRGGQRRDVATAVLDVMRERYEMAERVFYHHKKAAASAMLAKLVELAPEETKPRDDEKIYPAPWQSDIATNKVPHMTHLSDSEMIDYLGQLKVAPEHEKLQRSLYAALRFRRREIYRTLLVIDLDLVDGSKYGIDYVVNHLRGPEDAPSASGRWELEKMMSEAGGAGVGEVIVYCPSAKMQSKEVDARLEIKEDSVLPLRIQRGLFVYNQDVSVLQQYYKELWRAYLFVSPALFRDSIKCQAIVDVFCTQYGIQPATAYRKVRSHNFIIGEGVTIQEALKPVENFLASLPFAVVPPVIAARLVGEAAKDKEFLEGVKRGDDVRQRLSVLMETLTLREVLNASTSRFNAKQKKEIETYTDELLKGSMPVRIAARSNEDNKKWPEFDEYANELVRSVIHSD